MADHQPIGVTAAQHLSPRNRPSCTFPIVHAFPTGLGGRTGSFSKLQHGRRYWGRTTRETRPEDWNATMKSIVVGEILGPDLLVILAIVFVLFGGSQLPKLARSIGTARREFEHGLSGGEPEETTPSQKDRSTPATPDIMTKA